MSNVRSHEASPRKRFAVTVVWPMNSSPVASLIILSLCFAAPYVAVAQQIPRIGYLTTLPWCGSVPTTDAFRQGLRDLGYVEGKNIIIDCRSGDGKADRLPQLATELVNLNVNVIVAAGGELIARAAKQATQTIPIVMTNASDPVATGLIRSLARPGSNVTGLVTISPELGGKRLALLKEAFPKVDRVAVLTNPVNPEQNARLKELEVAAQALALQLQVLEVREPGDFDVAFSAMTRQNAHALLPLGDPLTVSNRTRLVDFAARNRLPAMYHRMEFVDVGGLMAYGPNYDDLFRRAATFVDKILKGARPGDLPVEQPTKFELVINLKTAKALGLLIAPSVLARADKIIE
jgi:putative ABC transport system substrate-binding protein